MPWVTDESQQAERTKQADQGRREFLERCAINYPHAAWDEEPAQPAARLVRWWSALWDAIEADAKARKSP